MKSWLRFKVGLKGRELLKQGSERGRDENNEGGRAHLVVVGRRGF